MPGLKAWVSLYLHRCSTAGLKIGFPLSHFFVSHRVPSCIINPGRVQTDPWVFPAREAGMEAESAVKADTGAQWSVEKR